MLTFLRYFVGCVFVTVLFDAVHAQVSDSGVKVRLVGGSSNGTGRLEIFNSGEWSTVYNSNFDQNDAAVVCKMLGFQDSGLASLFPNLFGPGTGTMIRTDFQCQGDESTLEKCSLPSTWYTSSSYSHAYDLAMSCEATPIRLVDGDDSQSGRVELFILNKWYTVCDDNFDGNDARVICQMLGFSDSGVSRAYSESHFGQGYGGVIVTNLRCDGTENDLKQCSSSWGTNNNNCDHREDAGVSCGRTQIRLVDGPTNTSGRVEVFHAGQWGTICSSGGFSIQDIRVICKMVGVKNQHAFGYTYAYYGQGIGHVMLSNLVCDGSESDLSQCSTSNWAGPLGSVSCSHSSDVGVNCEGKTPIRLVNGDSEQSGRVEIYNLGHWGTMSHNNFDNHALRVICRMLGYAYNSKSFFKTGAYYGQGFGHIQVSDLRCNGDESDIGHCSATWWPNTGSSSHSQDVGVSCDGHIPIRLVGDGNDAAGRVEILHDGNYQTICGENFDKPDLTVVCRMLGFENIPRSAFWRYLPTYDQGIGTIGASHLNCDGSEASIGQCGGYMPAYTRYCDHSKDVFVNCNGAPERIRLVGGNTNSSGRVEINVSGRWGTICDNGFGRTDAIVICRILKFPRPERAQAYSDAHYGQGNVSIVMSSLQCNGVEVNIGQCNPSLYTGNCYHSDDIGVNCCPNCVSGGQIVGK